MITERQRQILNSIVQDYIALAEPVSSKLLGKKHKFEISPATIRNEMQKLTDDGYLSQPHTSAGRVPTDKGYRFFVDKLFEGKLDTWCPIGHQVSNNLEFIKKITRFLAEGSSNLALGYLADDEFIWKDGWQDIFEEPEFLEPGFSANFARMIGDFEENIEEVFLPEVKVYIGRENPVSKVKDFSIITAGFDGGLFALLGPKRMSYDKNIELIQGIWEKI